MFKMTDCPSVKRDQRGQCVAVACTLGNVEIIRFIMCEMVNEPVHGLQLSLCHLCFQVSCGTTPVRIVKLSNYVV